MDDWDWNGDSTNNNGSGCENESLNNVTSGKIFGSRGRGFTPITKSFERGQTKFSKTEYGNSFNRKFNERNDNQENSYDTWMSEDNNDKRREFNGGRRWTDKERREPKNDNISLKKPKSTYVPEEPTENEEEIFGTGISSGINFDKYDDIEVKVSGENVPQPIHSFEEAGLRDYIVDLIKKCNYSKPTPIQKHSIPIIMSGRDMMACAQTGSGKTAAFLVPIINNLLEHKKELDYDGACKPQAIIVSPTRELTIQIYNEARKFSRGTILKIAISYGGTSVFSQLKNLEAGCHILVATSGRLLDFLRRGKVELSELKFFVLDEADRMLDMGFLPDMEGLLAHPSMVSLGERQTLMFSATFPEEVQELARKFLHNYLFVAVGIVGGACADVEQRFYSVTKFEKRQKLVDLLSEMGSSKCLVFVGQKRTTDFIATFLCEKDFPATSIHGDREQREREEALRDFKSGKMDVLVATSVAARGLDIKNVSHVVNFDLPKTIDEYVHRIGRTGRVGNRGMATSFYDPDQDKPLAAGLVKILSQAGQVVPDFLKNDVDCFSFNAPSKFGGRDCRNQNYQNDLGTAKKSTFEEEVW